MEPLRRAADLADAFLAGAATRPAGPTGTAEALRMPLPEHGVDAVQVVEELAAAADDGLVASAGPRYFGFVTGGALPAALAADWLASTWDQNSFSAVSSPAAATVEDVATGWLKELLGLPASATAGLTTGAQMANVTALAAARHAVLARAGWDVAEAGLIGAPAVRILAGAELHATIPRALRLLGFGTRAITLVAVDDQGAMRADALRAALDAGEGPAIVCAQAGNVNTGAFDPMDEIVAAAGEHDAWVHVDGAFGLWAAAAPALAHLTAGAAGADSWATDGHKWLNVPYDCGVVAVADPVAHAAAMSLRAAYLVRNDDGVRSNSDWVPEASRRARGFAVYAALRSLGRDGVAELVDRCCALARRLAAACAEDPRIEVLNDVVLNQVLLRVDDDDAATAATAEAIVRDGTCWVGGTVWQGRAAIRVSISSWRTTADDVDRSAAAIVSSVAI
ncbi:MAG: hypothetical protein QOE86_1074 [Solirubrobacteraceae bacterium]|nr:hypothetical protein [Solirubrobacteraceae bacterium]